MAVSLPSFGEESVSLSLPLSLRPPSHPAFLFPSLLRSFLSYLSYTNGNMVVEAEVQTQEGRVFLSRCLVGDGITQLWTELLQGLPSAIRRLGKACAAPSGHVVRSRSAAED